MGKICKFIKLLLTNPFEILVIITHRYPKFIKSDKIFLSIRYYNVFGRRINWNKPSTFNEKLQWLKIYNRNPLYTTLVDKYAVKEWVANIIGDQYIIPTIGVWNNVEDINFDELPNQFVLKCTHDSGCLYICSDKSQLNINKIKKDFSLAINRNYYILGREWPYKNVKPQIIAENYISEQSGDLKDYKFFSFNGEPKFFKIDFNRSVDHRANYYDIDMNLLPFGEECCMPDFNRKFEKPLNFEIMVDIVKQLSKNIPFARIDLYNSNGNIYFGEITFYPAAGLGKFIPEEWDYKIGELITLPLK